MIIGNIHHLALLPYLPAQLRDAIEYVKAISTQIPHWVSMILMAIMCSCWFPMTALTY